MFINYKDGHNFETVYVISSINESDQVSVSKNLFAKLR